jgi:hypothetical protein
VSSGNGASAPSGAGASKPFKKLTANELRGYIEGYAEERGIPWSPEEATGEDVRRLLQLDLEGLDKIARDGIWLDGEQITDDDLSFGEQEELQKLLREITGDDSITIEGSQMFQFLPALVTVLKRRENENYSIDDAKKLKASDLVKSDGAVAG